MTFIKKPINLLLACDLDRTVLPNGSGVFSKKSYLEFRKFAAREDVAIAYVSGRNLGLIKDAIEKYDIPRPDIAVGDVGTTMYFRKGGSFTPLEKRQSTPLKPLSLIGQDDTFLAGFIADNTWSSDILGDWNGYINTDLQPLIKGINNLTLQETEHQNPAKLSYYTPKDIDKNKLIKPIQKILQSKGIKAAVIFSIDEPAGVGLLDILPASATKKHALEYLQNYLGLRRDQIVYAGDSGNDLEPLTSGYKAIVVKNAREEVKAEIKEIASKNKVLSRIYFAQGGFHSMNGNYAAGILEGLNHFGYLE